MSTELSAKTLGGYKLVEKIGAGTGYGLQSLPAQPGALDCPQSAPLQDNETLIRFQRRSQAIARLRHRNIVIVYE